ncbi:unnamed protein product [Dibothriocephalus latus]|uniref:MARVEL domain-containing protein n=1 Tax=Dibothriocephalus latus TaxID=60516 RepID=A0A3P7LND5_DIBLA|nr:unnamed protein product [Dibothriocephalus latus]
MANLGYASTVGGVTKIINFIIGLVVMIIVAARINVYWGEGGYMLFASIFAWVFALGLLLLHIADDTERRAVDIFEVVTLGLTIIFVTCAFIIAAVFAGQTNHGILTAITVLFAVILIAAAIDFGMQLKKVLQA